MNDAAAFLPTLLCIGLLMAVTVALLAAFRIPHRAAPALAILRGAVQLAVISLILGQVITSPVWVGAALLVMFFVAAVTAARRLGWTWGRLGAGQRLDGRWHPGDPGDRLRHGRNRLHAPVRAGPWRDRDWQCHDHRHAGRPALLPRR